jgi:hypothetical protein
MHGRDESVEGEDREGSSKEEQRSQKKGCLNVQRREEEEQEEEEEVQMCPVEIWVELHDEQ